MEDFSIPTSKVLVPVIVHKLFVTPKNEHLCAPYNIILNFTGILLCLKTYLGNNLQSLVVFFKSGSHVENFCVM